MVGAGLALLLISAWGIWLARRGRIPGNRWFTAIAIGGMILPFLANTMGWIFTEMGRQPSSPAGPRSRRSPCGMPSCSAASTSRCS
jgi:cytochrome d ubiquinol oxidase subunit I